MLGMEKELGAIAPGYYADLVAKYVFYLLHNTLQALDMVIDYIS